MRISDWSSDVCSSDLLILASRAGEGAGKLQPEAAAVQQAGHLVGDRQRFQVADAGALQGEGLLRLGRSGQQGVEQLQAGGVETLGGGLGVAAQAVGGGADLRQVLLSLIRQEDLAQAVGGGADLRRVTLAHEVDVVAILEVNDPPVSSPEATR